MAKRKWVAGPLPNGAADWKPPTPDQIRERARVTDETLAEALNWIRRVAPDIAKRLESKRNG